MFTENCLYQLVEGVGGFLLFAKGRMYRDAEAKLLASWTVRNGMKQPDGRYIFTGGQVGTVQMKELVNSNNQAIVQLFNLKDEPVTLGNPI